MPDPVCIIEKKILTHHYITLNKNQGGKEHFGYVIQDLRQSLQRAVRLVRWGDSLANCPPGEQSPKMLTSFPIPKGTNIDGRDDPKCWSQSRNLKTEIPSSVLDGIEQGQLLPRGI